MKLWKFEFVAWFSTVFMYALFLEQINLPLFQLSCCSSWFAEYMEPLVSLHWHICSTSEKILTELQDSQLIHYWWWGTFIAKLDFGICKSTIMFLNIQEANYFAALLVVSRPLFFNWNLIQHWSCCCFL